MNKPGIISATKGTVVDVALTVSAATNIGRIYTTGLQDEAKHQVSTWHAERMSTIRKMEAQFQQDYLEYAAALQAKLD